MVREYFPEKGPDEVMEIPVPISLEILNTDPLRYRGQLMSLIAQSPWERPVKHPQDPADQELAEFCLNIDNLNDDVTVALDRIIENKPLMPDTQKALDTINAASPAIKIGADPNEVKTEKIHRIRLLSWIDYLDGLLITKNAEHDKSHKKQNPAA